MERIYKAYVANKNVNIYHRYFNNRNEFSLQITGGKWNYGTLFAPRLQGAIDTMRRELSKAHPRAKWHVIQDVTDKF